MLIPEPLAYATIAGVSPVVGLYAAKSTVTFHLSKLGMANAEPYTRRRAIVELCDLRIRDARLHDPDGSRFQIADAKTEAGIREVPVTPDGPTCWPLTYDA